MTKGLTILEILIALGIVFIITSLSYVAFSSLNTAQVLEKDTAGVVSLLKEAKSNTRSSIDASGYGVYFELGASRAVLFKGETYDENDPQNMEFAFSDRVLISDLNLADGGDTVVFERPKGDTLDQGNIVLSLNDNSGSSTIAVYPTGSIEVLP